MARNLPRQDIPVYAHDPYLLVGIDAVESDRHQRPCLDNAPDLIAVDEALGRRDPRFDAPTT